MIRRFSAPAKVNLYLRIAGRRRDGYHLLQSGMVFFPWFDRVEIDTDTDDITLTCEPGVTASQEENLAWRAAETLRRLANIPAGARIHLRKHIPHGSGLGGGSSDAALVLLALNRMWGLHWPVPRLAAVGLELGADVPFFVGGVAARVSGIGEQRTPCNDCPDLHLVVVHPDQPLATAAVYRGVTSSLLARADLETFPVWAAQHTRNGLLLANDLQPIACGLAPIIETVIAKLTSRGARHTVMSGSGSAVFGVFRDADDAKRAQHIIATEEIGWHVQHGQTFRVHPFDREWQSGI
ncbi:MAG: 4-(cytidine 5'-diphospho)-2-C-methyl-D-erythritol kinase [Magnetococcales bacterium]|nr:4-(cytidine 5'-diphospho)-2-C-methyl-D-erythritol kinase [Magnetococcales bacterium]